LDSGILIWAKTKKARILCEFELLLLVDLLLVELQGIEPWSREIERVRSTCLVAFDCRNLQARQQPKQIRSYCYLNNVAQQQRSPVYAVDTAVPAPLNRVPGNDGLHRSYQRIS